MYVGLIVYEDCLIIEGVSPIEIGLEQAPFVFLFLFFISSFEHVKSPLIMGPINTKTVHKSVILSYSTMKMF